MLQAAAALLHAVRSAITATAKLLVEMRNSEINCAHVFLRRCLGPLRVFCRSVKIRIIF